MLIIVFVGRRRCQLRVAFVPHDSTGTCTDAFSAQQMHRHTDSCATQTVMAGTMVHVIKCQSQAHSIVEEIERPHTRRKNHRQKSKTVKQKNNETFTMQSLQKKCQHDSRSDMKNVYSRYGTNSLINLTNPTPALKMIRPTIPLHMSHVN